MRRSLVLLTTILALLVTGCDSAGPNNDEPAPRFDMTLSAPLNASIEGEAALAGGSSFEDQSLFTFPLPRLNKTFTAIQLVGEDAEGTTHDLSFLHIADEATSPGTYEINNVLGPCADEPATDCPPESLFAHSLFTAHYARQTADTLFSYTLDRGTVIVENATDDAISGTFDLRAPAELAVARADLNAYLDALRTPGLLGPEDLPEPPPVDLRLLDEPLMITGSFTATPGELSNRVNHFNWMMSGNVAVFGRP